MSNGTSVKSNSLIQCGVANLKHGEFLNLKSEFDFVKQYGIKFNSKNFILLYVLPAHTQERKIGIICGRKFDKKAVVRNRVRRLFKEAYRLIKNQVALSLILFIPKKGAEQRRAQDIQDEMIKIFQKAKLWTEIPKT